MSNQKYLEYKEKIETELKNFFDEYKIEKLSIEDGNGNKAKLSRTKDNGIKIEYSSTVLM